MKATTSMMKWTFVLLMVALGSLQAKADDVYYEDFGTTQGAVYVSVLPDGWDCKGKLGSFEREADKYKSKKYAIAIHPNTENYLISPRIAAGDFSIYLRQYTKNYAASASVYYCKEVDGEFVIGEKIGEDAYIAKGATTWTLFKYTLEKDSRVAILFDGVLDDFVATNGLSTTTDEPEVDPENPDTPGTEPEEDPNPTAITNAANATVSGRSFNVNGQGVKANDKGIRIVNGKKYIRK